MAKVNKRGGERRRIFACASLVKYYSEAFARKTDCFVACKGTRRGNRSNKYTDKDLTLCNCAMQVHPLLVGMLV